MLMNAAARKYDAGVAFDEAEALQISRQIWGKRVALASTLRVVPVLAKTPFC
jgi:hypothetical protein